MLVAPARLRTGYQSFWAKNLKCSLVLRKTIANIYFNKECFKHRLTPTYLKIKIKDTNKAATKTKGQSQTLRIKNELHYLEIKESGINNYLQNDGVKIYGKNWPIIEKQIHEQIKHKINKEIQYFQRKNRKNEKNKNNIKPR